MVSTQSADHWLRSRVLSNTPRPAAAPVRTPPGPRSIDCAVRSKASSPSRRPTCCDVARRSDRRRRGAAGRHREPRRVQPAEGCPPRPRAVSFWIHACTVTPTLFERGMTYTADNTLRMLRVQADRFRLPPSARRRCGELTPAPLAFGAMASRPCAARGRAHHRVLDARARRHHHPPRRPRRRRDQGRAAAGRLRPADDVADRRGRLAAAPARQPRASAASCSTCAPTRASRSFLELVRGRRRRRRGDAARRPRAARPRLRATCKRSTRRSCSARSRATA